MQRSEWLYIEIIWLPLGDCLETKTKPLKVFNKRSLEASKRMKPHLSKWRKRTENKD